MFAAIQGQPQLKPIYDVVEYPQNPYVPLIVGILIGLICVVLIYFVWAKYFRKTIQGPIFTPEELALKALAQLKKQNLIQTQKQEMFFTELSRIVRIYIEAQFDIHAPDMTTEEFLEYVKKDQKLSVQEKSDLKDFMDVCDQVKFAKLDPTEEEASRMLDLAETFIKRTTNSYSS